MLNLGPTVFRFMSAGVHKGWGWLSAGYSAQYEVTGEGHLMMFFSRPTVQVASSLNPRMKITLPYWVLVHACRCTEVEYSAQHEETGGGHAIMFWSISS